MNLMLRGVNRLEMSLLSYSGDGRHVDVERGWVALISSVSGINSMILTTLTSSSFMLLKHDEVTRSLIQNQMW